MQTVDFLRLIDPFQSLSDARLSALADQFVRRSYTAGKKIIARGDPGDSMYIVRKGSLRVVVLDDAGQERYVTKLGPGECVGEMALLTGEPRTADVYADTDSDCLVIEREPLEKLLKANPSVAAFLTEILGKRMLEAQQIQKVGKYRLVGELGRGGIAIVYEGIHPELNRTVAIKMLSHALVYDSEFSTRFRNEAKIIAGLEHENIVRVFDCEEAYATYFIIMEKLVGIDLTRMREVHGTVSEEKTREIVLQLASALDYAHRHGIIHRDIKPENAIINTSNHVKLMDFGIAMTRSEEESSDDIIGTAEYMSPEQALGKKIDGRADIYSLGIMTFELLTGRLPFESPDPYEILRKHLNDRMPNLRDFVPDASQSIVEFVEKACRKDPEKRFRNCAEIIRHLGGLKSRGHTVMRAKTITVFYDPAEEGHVQASLERFTESAEQVPGTQVKVSDLGEIG